MGRLLGVLEGYSNPIEEDDFLRADLMKPEENEDEDDFLLAKITTLMEDARDIQENADEIEAMDDVLDEADASVERLTAIRNTVDKYGVCRAIMEISDPNHELVEKGYCCSYEEFSAVPMKDADAVSVITGINKALLIISNKVEAISENRKVIDDMQRITTGYMLATLSEVDWKNYDCAVCGRAVMLHTYDKVKWHLEGKDSVDPKAAEAHVSAVMHWLAKHEMLTDEGTGALKDGVDSKFAITDTMLTGEGNRVMKKCYHQWLKNCKYGEEPSMKTLEKCCGKE